MIYRHYKGACYELVGTCKDSETTVEMVIYKGTDGAVWVRPAITFYGKVEKDGKLVDRFRKVMRRETAIKLVKVELKLEGCVDNLLDFQAILEQFLVQRLNPDFTSDIDVSVWEAE